MRKLCNATFTLYYDVPTQDETGQETENLLPVPEAEDIPCLYYTKANPGQFSENRTWIGVAAIILTFEEFELPVEGAPLAVRVNHDEKVLYVREATVQDSQGIAQMYICTEMRDG